MERINPGPKKSGIYLNHIHEPALIKCRGTTYEHVKKLKKIFETTVAPTEGHFPQ